MSSSEEPKVPAGPGERVGHYEIVSELGRGGMGIVYRARDVHLGREVALKCLHPEASDDLDHRRRFLREARAASQLSSPYIVPVFEVFEEVERPWLAMEFVKGRSLRKELRGTSGLPISQVILYGEEVAEALEVAHAKGILHRDVSPGNILITQEGRARLTDFGLAKRFVPPDQTTSAATESMPLTQQGGILGTLGYMSPEQVLGRPLDPRADIFSLGCVLYEMCTGKATFHGANQGEFLDAILHHEPESISRLNYEVPEELERIVRKSLAKNPDERYQHVGELKTDLRSLHQLLDYRSYEKEHPEVSGEVPAPRQRRPWVPALAAAMGVVGVVVLVKVLWPPSEPGGRPFPDRALESLPLVTWPTDELGSRISPDQEWISFLSGRGGGRNLWVRKLSGGESQPLTSPPGRVLSHVWSPDGDEIAYLVEEGSARWLRIVPAPLRERPRLNLRVDYHFERLIRWVGSTLYLESLPTGLWRLPLDGDGAEEIVLDDAGFTFRTGFDLGPERDLVVFSGLREGEKNIWVSGLDGKNLRQITREGREGNVYSPRWMGKSRRRIVYLSNKGGQVELWEAEWPEGSRRQIPFAGRLEAIDHVSADGSLMTVGVVQERADLWWLDPGAHSELQLSADTLNDFEPTVSTASDRIAFQRGKNVASDILDAQVFVARRTSSGLDAEHLVVQDGFSPSLSADGRWIAFLKKSYDSPLSTALALHDLDTGRERILTDRFQQICMRVFPLSFSRAYVWSRRAPILFFVALSGSHAAEIQRYGADDLSIGVVFSTGARGKTIRDLHLSPDGERLAFVIHVVADGEWQVHDLLLRTGEARLREVFYREVFLQGIRMDGTSFVVLDSFVNADGERQSDIVTCGREGSCNVVGTADSSFPETARLDVDNEILYLTMAEEDIHNLYAFSLGEKRFARVTDNRLPGVTFSGQEPLPDGTLVVSRHQRNKDLWLIRLDR
jgi:serine/threonine protein kinase